MSPAVELQGGTLLHPSESVSVRALPDHLPQSIEYSIESLVDFDTTIHVRDLTIPDDVTLLTDGDEIIAKVQAPRVEEVVEVAAEVGEGARRARRPPRVRPPRARPPRRSPTRADAPASGCVCGRVALRARPPARREDDREAHRHLIG